VAALPNIAGVTPFGGNVHDHWHDTRRRDVGLETRDMFYAVLQHGDARIDAGQRGQPLCGGFGIIGLGRDEQPIDRLDFTGIERDFWRRLDNAVRRFDAQVREWRAGAEGDVETWILSKPRGDRAANRAGANDGDALLHFFRLGAFELSAAAISAASLRATASFAMRGQASVLSFEIRMTAFSAPPITSPETSFATIQSQPFLAILARACSSTLFVSAAKPMTSFGRFLPAFESVARMSGFSCSAMAGAPLASFLILALASLVGRQSATSATMTATSRGRAASLASNISRALSTLTRFTPCGAGRLVGPETRVTSAPSSASAAAMA